MIKSAFILFNKVRLTFLVFPQNSYLMVVHLGANVPRTYESLFNTTCECFVDVKWKG